MILRSFNRPSFEGLRPTLFLRGGIDRLLSDIFDVAIGPIGNRPDVFPAVNVTEDGAALCVEAELPGLKLDDLEILVRGDELTIKGERKSTAAKGDCFQRRERGVGPFCRVLRLPVEVDPDKVEAHLQDGVLTVTLPKVQAALPRKIKVAT